MGNSNEFNLEDFQDIVNNMLNKKKLDYDFFNNLANNIEYSYTEYVIREDLSERFENDITDNYFNDRFVHYSAEKLAKLKYPDGAESGNYISSKYSLIDYLVMLSKMIRNAKDAATHRIYAVVNVYIDCIIKSNKKDSQFYSMVMAKTKDEIVKIKDKKQQEIIESNGPYMDACFELIKYEALTDCLVYRLEEKSKNTNYFKRIKDTEKYVEEKVNLKRNCNFSKITSVRKIEKKLDVMTFSTYLNFYIASKYPDGKKANIHIISDYSLESYIKMLSTKFRNIEDEQSLIIYAEIDLYVEAVLKLDIFESQYFTLLRAETPEELEEAKKQREKEIILAGEGIDYSYLELIKCECIADCLSARMPESKVEEKHEQVQEVKTEVENKAETEIETENLTEASNSKVQTLSSDFVYEVEENEKEFKFEIDLPGVSKEDIELEYDGEILIVTVVQGREKFIGKSFRYKTGEIAEDEIDAKLENGVLTLIAIKKNKRKKINITIK